MRYQILTKIESDDNLATLLNAFQRELGLLEQVVLPRDSMGEFNRLLASATSAQPSQDAQQLLSYLQPRFYQLQVLSNSLTDLHKNINWAIKDLTNFFVEYEGNLLRYAIENRMKVIDEFGSEDETDWEEDGFDDEGPKWKVAYKDAEESLRHYTLHNDLQQYFAGSDSRGEKIGTSHAEDFRSFSEHVRRATEFNPFKLLRKFTGAELPVYHENETGEMVAQTLGDEVEDELNEDLKNQSLVHFFEQVLVRANQAAASFTFATTAEDYRQLLTQLETIRDVRFL
ncbi:hypothetical protein [Hymenobacter crusticola]|uniref:Uncharacterized protein n=1 Tax=Hymenobacter crusticola TaxID=1770526 RepID=A0A243W5L2_9BACT|nr:hypothetical protein [Hymenobacter crusticola]OUJ68046.1 hypothetical protein BXP70_28155 [Hymenobacter crusticola]